MSGMGLDALRSRGLEKRIFCSSYEQERSLRSLCDQEWKVRFIQRCGLAFKPDTNVFMEKWEWTGTLAFEKKNRPAGDSQQKLSQQVGDMALRKAKAQRHVNKNRVRLD